eukprot:10875184-Alexandrium_andersonii.AAC.1
MSASLVGSEMCIRDRGSRPERRSRQAREALAQGRVRPPDLQEVQEAPRASAGAGDDVGVSHGA